MANISTLQSLIARETDECIEWPGGRRDGYGCLRYQGRLRGAHIVACELAHGPKPDDKDVCAHAPIICHNRLCINPRHLRWATHRENIADQFVDGSRPFTHPADHHRTGPRHMAMEARPPHGLTTPNTSPRHRFTGGHAALAIVALLVIMFTTTCNDLPDDEDYSRLRSRGASNDQLHETTREASELRGDRGA